EAEVGVLAVAVPRPVGVFRPGPALREGADEALAPAAAVVADVSDDLHARGLRGRGVALDDTYGDHGPGLLLSMPETVRIRRVIEMTRPGPLGFEHGADEDQRGECDLRRLHLLGQRGERAAQQHLVGPAHPAGDNDRGVRAVVWCQCLDHLW